MDNWTSRERNSNYTVKWKEKGGRKKITFTSSWIKSSLSKEAKTREIEREREIASRTLNSWLRYRSLAIYPERRVHLDYLRWFNLLPRILPSDIACSLNYGYLGSQRAVAVSDLPKLLEVWRSGLARRVAPSNLLSYPWLISRTETR